MSGAEARADEELLAATTTDPDAFAAFYRRHSHGVFAYFMSRLQR
jgi:hypothetical protein